MPKPTDDEPAEPARASPMPSRPDDAATAIRRATATGLVARDSTRPMVPMGRASSRASRSRTACRTDFPGVRPRRSGAVRSVNWWRSGAAGAMAPARRISIGTVAPRWPPSTSCATPRRACGSCATLLRGADGQLTSAARDDVTELAAGINGASVEYMPAPGWTERTKDGYRVTRGSFLALQAAHAPLMTPRGWSRDQQKGARFVPDPNIGDASPPLDFAARLAHRWQDRCRSGGAHAHRHRDIRGPRAHDRRGRAAPRRA